MSKRRLLKVGVAMSLAVWAIAIALFLVVLSLPDFHSRPTVGCYVTDAMLVFVECRGTGYDGLLSSGMTLSIYWVAAPLVWLALGAGAVAEGYASGLIYIGLFALWLLTVVLIATALFRFVRHRLTARSTN